MRSEKVCVCVLFGEHCCTFMPNNTSFTKAMDKLKNWRKELKQNAGFEHQFFDWLENMLGGWGAWLAKLGVTIGAALLVLTVVLCCVLPS